MIRTWLSAAAAAGSLSAGMPPEVTPSFASQSVETQAQHAPQSERARIVGIAKEVRRLVVRFAEVNKAAVVAPRPLRDLGVDELALADVVLGLETRFGIDIDDAEAAAWETVGDVVGYVARRARGATA
jgi:acyl carrier protein